MLHRVIMIWSVGSRNQSAHAAVFPGNDSVLL